MAGTISTDRLAALRPARLPRTEDELAAWSVYADALSEQGDRLGDQIQRDLAIDADPPPGTLEDFHATARYPRDGEALRLIWRLAHLREVHVDARANHGALARLAELIASPRGRVLEALAVPAIAATPADRDHWARLYAALPPSCTRVELGPLRAGPGAFAEHVARCPPHVRTLRLPFEPVSPEAAAAIDDRFDVVELARLSPDSAPTVLGALARARHVRVVVDEIAELALDHPRIALGDAGWIQPAQRAAGTFPRVDPALAQRAQGLLPIRVALRDDQPVTYYDVRIEAGRARLEASATPAGKLVRRGATCYVRGGTATVDGVPVRAGTLAPLRDGARVQVPGADELVVVARDLDARARAALAG